MRKKRKKAQIIKLHERERVCVSLCVRERKDMCVRERKNMCVHVCVSVCERERKNMCVCVSRVGDSCVK